MTIKEFIDMYGPHVSKQTKKPLFQVKQELTKDLRLVIKKHNALNKSYRCLILHRWSKWEQFHVEIPGNAGEIKQRRICLACDKVQEQFVEFPGQP
ncbi:MAG: hypothetical protein ACUZ8H_01475 [Candidatus Anammoxibacter sp.]